MILKVESIRAPREASGFSIFATGFFWNGDLLLRGDGGDLEVDGVDCTLFKSVGVAVQDVAVAAAVVDRARALGLGATARL